MMLITNMKYVYSMMYDDLKDADMMAGYAEKTIENPEYSKYYQEEAQKRLTMFNSRHERFTRFVKEYKAAHPEHSSDNMCWKMSHEHYLDWYSSIKSKLDNLSKL